MKRTIKIPLISAFLTLFCLFQLNGNAMANKATIVEAESLYHSALAYYKNEKYDKAISQLKSAVALESKVAKYHHILAVSYGRQAEKANWLKAMDYANKTLTHLEKADKLDPNNLEILDDLMEFYHEAPGFLGGDITKGDKIEVLINKLSLKSQQNGNM